jgi:hypothetical protein
VVGADEMTGAIIMGEKCPYCCKFRSPLEFVHQPGGVKICLPCEQRHLEALEALSSGKFTGECSECGTKYEELRAAGKCGPQGEMAVHFENGKYRVLCLSCNLHYVRLRRELYGETEFGRLIGLDR